MRCRRSRCSKPCWTAPTASAGRSTRSRCASTTARGLRRLARTTPSPPDSHYLAGVTAASGSRASQDFVPAKTSAAVERLEAAGAVIFAKTTTPEFCYFGITESPVNGRTSNPWNLERTPGGSSGA
jgi:Asp-tRNA(Asn)/Glu-tRNA(Gln) amidotransferase A subunit family amidase